MNATMTNSIAINPAAVTDNSTGTPASKPRWLGVEVRHLAALAAVAREGSFRGAAESLGYVQSAVSQQVARLERIVGTRLVDRRRGATHVDLTESGELLLHHFEAIVARLNAAQADIDAIRGGRAGSLRVGITESIAARLMPPLLRRLACTQPDIEVHVEELRSPDQLAGRAEEGDLDVGLGVLPPGRDALEIQRLMVDPWVLVVAADSLFAAGVPAFVPGDLNELPLISGGHEATPPSVDADLREHGLEPVYAYRSESSASVKALVAAGVGVAILPGLVVDPLDPRLTLIPLDGVVRPRVLGAYWNRERRSVAVRDVFVEAAVAVAAEIGGSVH